MKKKTVSKKTFIPESISRVVRVRSAKKLLISLKK